jgi:hypothetical protein
MSWNNTNGCGGCGSETPTKTCCEELLETQKVEITDQNGVKSIHTAISEAVETNNKLDEVIVEKDGVKKISVDADITIPPVEIDKDGLSTEAKQDATITALNEAKTEIVNAINNINVNVDLSPTNAILEEMKSQNQAQIDIANAIKLELEKKTDQTELVTEVDRIIAAIQAGGGGGSQIDYTTQLADILAKLQLIVDKEDVETDYTTLLNGLGDKLDTINTNIVKLESQYNQVLADILAKLQAINTNTDELESQIQELIEKPGYDDTALKQVITDFQNVMVAESDETQTLITAFKDEVKAENDETQALINDVKTNTNTTNSTLTTINSNLTNLRTEAKTESDETQTKLDILNNNTIAGNTTLTNIKNNIDTLNTNLTAFKNEAKAESDQTQELLQSIGCSVIPIAEGYFTNLAKTRISLKTLNPLENNLFTMITSISPSTITKDSYNSGTGEIFLNVPNPLPGSLNTPININTSIGGVVGSIVYVVKDVDGILVVERASGCAKQNMSITQTNVMSNAFMDTQIQKLDVIAETNEAKKDINKKASLPTSNTLLGTNGLMGFDVVTDLMMQNTGTSGNVIITDNDVSYTIAPGEVRYHSGTRDYAGQTYTVEAGAIFEVNFARKV